MARLVWASCSMIRRTLNKSIDLTRVSEVLSDAGGPHGREAHASPPGGHRSPPPSPAPCPLGGADARPGAQPWPLHTIPASEPPDRTGSRALENSFLRGERSLYGTTFGLSPNLLRQTRTGGPRFTQTLSPLCSLC